MKEPCKQVDLLRSQPMMLNRFDQQSFGNPCGNQHEKDEGASHLESLQERATAEAEGEEIGSLQTYP